jgi:hypothetical protein
MSDKAANTDLEFQEQDDWHSIWYKYDRNRTWRNGPMILELNPIPAIVFRN